MDCLPHIAARLLGAPLAISPAKLDVILASLGTRIGVRAGDTRDVPTFTLPTSTLSASSPARTASGLLSLPVRGSLVSRGFGGVDALSGLTSYETLAAQLDAAERDVEVRGVLLDIDSFGGEAQGAFDLADRIASFPKPTVAAVNDNAYSAAYLLASAADTVFVSRTGGVGSIGVVTAHVDSSAADAEAGRRYTFIHAGARKVDGNPHEPLTDRARDTMQAEVDRLYGLFVNTVASHGRLDADAIRATEAGTFHGENAVKSGLADRLGTRRDALKHLHGAVSAPRPFPTAARAAKQRRFPVAGAK